MIQRTLDLSYDNLIIGYNLSALYYSYINKIPIINLRINKPIKHLENIDYKKEIELWNKLSTILSLDKYIPLSDKLLSIRILDSSLICSTKNNLIVNIKFNKLHIFDDYKIENLPEFSHTINNIFHVIDYFHIKSGASHNIDFLDSKDDFVKKVIFYPSNRIPNGFNYNNRKDCYSISTIKSSDVHLEEYSQNYARLKITSMMHEAGIKGYYEKKDNYYRKVLLESDNRQVYSLGKNIYKNIPDNIQFHYENYNEIQNCNYVEDKYIEYIKQYYVI